MVGSESSDSGQDRITRYRKLATLIGGDAEARLNAAARRFELERNRFVVTKAAISDELRKSAVLLADIDIVLMHCREERQLGKRLRQPLRYSADDLREESRLCREEAAAANNLTLRRVLAAQSLDLAMIAEEQGRADVIRAAAADD